MNTVWWVHIKDGKRYVHGSLNGFEPTKANTGADAVIGPFATKRAAYFMARRGSGNPHLQHVRDAERISKELGYDWRSDTTANERE